MTIARDTKRSHGLHIACRWLLFVCMSLIISGCTCSSEHQSDETTLTPEQEEELVLSTPQTFDAQQMHEFAQLIETGKLQPNQVAPLITMQEAALNKLEAQLEDLLRNEDAADSYAVLTEWASTQWTADFVIIDKYLAHVPLPDRTARRAATVTKATHRARQLITQIETSQLNGKKTGLKI